VHTNRHKNLARRKRRIERRLRPRTWTAQASPMYQATNIQYEHSDRVRGLASGGIGAMHQLAQHTGLVAAIDQQGEVLKRHLPYHESDHVLGIAYHVLCGGTCLQDIERRRQNEMYLDALGAQRIPDRSHPEPVCTIATIPGHDQRRRESAQSHPSREAERQALARGTDDAPMGRRWRPRSRQGLPSTEGVC
jgi:hypothetical protein